MCGRYIGFAPYEDYELQYLMEEVYKKINESTLDYNFKTTGEIFPTDVVPVIISRNNKLTMHPMKWGFISKDNKTLINARSETINNLYTWKDVIKTNRCIIPSNGFYEWDKKDKTKYKFNVINETPLFMAGLYKIFPYKDKQLVHFSIITTQSNSSIIDVHDRMPVIIKRDEFDKWLGNDFESLLKRNDIMLEKEIA